MATEAETREALVAELREDASAKRLAAKERLRRWVSPDMIALGNLLSRRGVRFKGRFESWAEAEATADGYHAQEILDRAIGAARSVREGRAAFDRDGTTFLSHEHHYPLLTGLFRAAACSGGRLSVLDFGGALGSSYHRCRSWLGGLPSPLWIVVEQENFVAAGRREFETRELRFASSIDEAISMGAPNVALLSSVLQYLPRPSDVLLKLDDAELGTIIIDRTPVIQAQHSIITVQHVPSAIVKSSYAARLFTRADLSAPISRHYKIVGEFSEAANHIFSLGKRIVFEGMVLARR
jgi:putative methyltransferase (TIGR04325 family)